MANEARSRTVIYYADQDGREPFAEWLESLSIPFQDRVFRRLQRVQLGNFGDHKGVGEGIHELRLHFGKGYRIYYGQDGDDIVLLLCGGDKSRQRKNIKQAKRYWEAYQMNKDV